MTAEPFTVGAEEEYLVVDRETGNLRPRGGRILAAAEDRLGTEVTAELIPSQLEVATPICGQLDEVRSHLHRLRTTLASVAAEHASAIAPLGAHPAAEWLGQGITESPRYQALDEAYQQLAREQLICGCHVHVAVHDADVAVRIMDHLTPWLPAVLALSANSPFWQGVDTGYASYRTMLFDRWPTSGPPLPLGGRDAYDRLVDSLVRAGAIPDATTLYWDVRPSARYETLEVRVADVCLSVDEATMVAGLARSLVRTLHDRVQGGEPAPLVRPELTRAARWRAARYGLSGELIDPVRCTEVPARVLVERLLDLCRNDLQAHGEWDFVAGQVERILVGGNGADRQRRVFARRGSFRDVVAYAVETVETGTSEMV